MFARLDEMRSQLATIRSKGFKAKRSAADKAALRVTLTEIEAAILGAFNSVQGEANADRVADQAARELAELTGKDNAPTATATEVKAVNG